MSSHPATTGKRPRRRFRNNRGLTLECLEPRQLLANDFLLTWAAGLIVGDFGGSRGGIFVSRPDGSEMRQITVSQTNNFQFSGDGLNLPDDHPSFSPDGTEIVFTSSRFQEPGETNNFEICVMNVDGSNVRRLTNSPGMDTEPVFSPDGSKIAFSSDRAGNLDIWAMNVDGTGLTQLTNNPKNENEPAWSHSGNRLSFTRIEFGGVAGLFGARKDVYIMSANGANQTPIANLEAEEHDAVWSLDDTKLIVTTEKDDTLPFGDVAVIDITTRQYVSNLTVDDRVLRIGGGGDPTLSPDGTKIAYFKATGGPLLLAGPQKIHVMNANGTNKHKINAPGIINVHPHFGRLADSDQDGKPDYIDADSPSDFNAAMIQDEARVLAFLGDLVNLESVVGVGRLATRGYVPAHLFDSFQGQGVAFARDLDDSQPSVLGVPDVLLYQPTLTGGRNPTDAFPDFDYRLIGWGYATHYDPSTIPTFGGFPEDAWLVHEAGFHRLNGTFDPTPPAGDIPRGTKPGNIRPSDEPLTPWHERLWDIHFFRRPNGGTPVAAIVDPFGRNLPGNPTGTDAFFYPQLPFRGQPRSGSRLEAEDFDLGKDVGWKDNTAGNFGDAYRVTDVDIEPTLDSSGGYDVVKLEAGEFLQYTVQVPLAGHYELSLRLVNGNPGGKFRVEIDGVNVSGSLSFPTTTSVLSPDSYGLFTPISQQLSRGKHNVRLVMEQRPVGHFAPLRLNWMRLTRAVAPGATLKPIETIGFPDDSVAIQVHYRDNSAIDLDTIDGSDLQVTGPLGFSASTMLESKSVDADGTSVTAIYRMQAPGTAWDQNDNGTYTVNLVGSQVRDLTGVAAAARTIGTFQVDMARFAVRETPFLGTSTVFVTGDESREVFSIARTANSIQVTRNGAILGTAPISLLQKIVVASGGGNDTLTAAGLGIPVEFYGGDGNDSLTGGTSDDTLHGGKGDDSLFGGPGDDMLFGDAGSDTLDGGPGNNTLDEGPGTGGMVVRGTPGNDVILIDREATAAGVKAIVTINDRRLSIPYRRGETIIVHAGAGNDVVKLTGSARQVWHAHFIGGAGNDVLIGGILDDVLDGGYGDDTLFGLDGDDQLLGGSGRDRLFGGAGDDLLDGGPGNDLLEGSSGSDLLLGRAGADRLLGDTGRDMLIGGRGPDQLFGENADDILIGGFTKMDADTTALRRVLNIWNLAVPLSERTHRLRWKLNSSNVADDAAIDRLFGQQGHDWFLDFKHHNRLADFAAADILNC